MRPKAPAAGFNRKNINNSLTRLEPISPRPSAAKQKVLFSPKPFPKEIPSANLTDNCMWYGTPNRQTSSQVVLGDIVTKRLRNAKLFQGEEKPMVRQSHAFLALTSPFEKKDKK